MRCAIAFHIPRDQIQSCCGQFHLAFRLLPSPQALVLPLGLDSRKHWQLFVCDFLRVSPKRLFHSAVGQQVARKS